LRREREYRREQCQRREVEARHRQAARLQHNHAAHNQARRDAILRISNCRVLVWCAFEQAPLLSGGRKSRRLIVDCAAALLPVAPASVRPPRSAPPPPPPLPPLPPLLLAGCWPMCTSVTPAGAGDPGSISVSSLVLPAPASPPTVPAQWDGLPDGAHAPDEAGAGAGSTAEAFPAGLFAARPPGEVLAA